MGLSAILVFVGAKMLLIDVYKIPILASLGVIAVILAVSVLASLLRPPAAGVAPGAPPAAGAAPGAPPAAGVAPGAPPDPDPAPASAPGAGRRA